MNTMTPRASGRGIRLGSVVAPLAVALLMPAVVSAQPPDRIELPDGWRPEGVAAADGRLYVGSLRNGAVVTVDPSTGDRARVVKGRDGNIAVGVEVEPANGRLWVAGGVQGEVRAYDLETGELLETYPFNSGFLNDLVATPEAVYVTDSRVPELVVIPLRKKGGLKAPGQARSMVIEGDLMYEDDAVNANGIAASPAGLIVVQSQPGALFLIDPETGLSTRIDTGDIDLTWGDGLELDGRTLYVVRNRLDSVSVLQLDEAFASASLLAELTSPELDVPSTGALLDGDLWLANARFTTTPEPDTAYWLSRLDLPSIPDESATPEPSAVPEAAEAE